MRNIVLLIVFLSVSILGQNQTLFQEDFEDGLTGWTAINLVDSTAPTLWRITNTRYVSPGHSAAWNDSILNSYPHGRYEALESPPVTIPYNTRTFLKFKAFIHLTFNGVYYHDYFHVKYTTNNGNTWNNFLPYANSGQQLVWRSFPEDFGPTAYNELTYLAGKTMKFRFITRSDTLDPNGLGVFLDDFYIYTNQCELVDPNEPNNSTATATEVSLGDIIHTSLCPQNDEDFYKFTAQQGDQLNIATQHTMPYTYLYLLNSNGFTLKYAYNEMTYSITSAGTYYLRVTGSFNYSANYSIYFNSRPEPDVISVTDIPDDQGLKVRVKWQASFYDPQNVLGKIKEYQLWRKVNDSSSVNENTNIKKIIKNGNQLQLEDWEYIASIPALSGRPFLNYSYAAPTLQDNEPTTFIIAAIPKVETIPIAWGLEGSGFSVDNLSPEPGDFSVVQTNQGISINWNNNYSANPDIDKIEIFKGVYEIFPPLTEYKIASLPSSSNTFLDDNLLTGFTYYYIISITDKSGNTAYSPVLNTVVVTSVYEDEFLPKDILLKQNYPNPFNPATMIEFSLPSAMRINLKIYDIIGREIKEIAGGNYGPGNHRIEFNASELPSGIYFYTLSTENTRQTRKLMLVK